MLFSINTSLHCSVSTPIYVAQYQHLLMLLSINTYLCCSVSTPILCCSVSTPIYIAQCTQNSSPVCFPADWPRPGYGRVSSCHSRWARTPARSCLPSPAREQRHSEHHVLTHTSTFVSAFTCTGTKIQWTTCVLTHTSTFMHAVTCMGTKTQWATHPNSHQHAHTCLHLHENKDTVNNTS